jgi:transposase
MKTYFRKRQVAQRYGVGVRTVERMQGDGRLPPPDLILSRSPLWSDELLEAHERAAVLRASSSKQTTTAETSAEVPMNPK